MSNLLKGFYVSVKDDHRVVDSNEMARKKVQEEEERRARLKAISDENYDSDGFFEGLPVENVDELLVDRGEEPSAVIKGSAASEELEKTNHDIEVAKEQLESIKLEVASMLEEAQTEAEGIKTEAYEQGRSEGYEAGYSEGMAAVEGLKSEVNQMAQDLETDYQNKVFELEPNFVDALTDIYEHIFKVDLATYRGIVSNLLIDTINSSGESRDIIVHIAREDYPTIMEQKEEILTETGVLPGNVEFVQDATLAPASCLIETAGGVFDCSLETELRELKRKLMILSYRRE